MLNGFYAIKFQLPDVEEKGGGVVILLNGKIYGGDSSFSYQGVYQTEKSTLTGSLRVLPFNDFLQSIFADFEDIEDDIAFSGTFDAKGFLLKGKLYGIEDTLEVQGTLLSVIS